MFMHSEKMKRSIERSCGIKFEEIETMDVTEIDKHIEKKIGKKLTFMYSKDSRLMSRGTVYIYLNKILTMAKIEKKLAKI